MPRHYKRVSRTLRQGEHGTIHRPGSPVAGPLVAHPPPNGYTKMPHLVPLVLTTIRFAVIIIDDKSIGLASLTAPIQAIGAVLF
jgi:hypothetical protein